MVDSALVLNVLAVLTMIPDWINGTPDRGDFAGLALFLACLTLLLAERVRKHFLWRGLA
jgi:hypothetical protein